MPFIITKTDIKDVLLIKPKAFHDDRGFFMEIYKKSEFEQHNIEVNFVQENYSLSKKNVLRGLHYQIHPYAQGKLVKCTRGKIFDVAVDIRKTSATYKKWVGYELSGYEGDMLWIPKGFAHGFVTLSDEAEVMYKVSGSEYSPQHERAIIYNDPQIGISWPVKNVTVSEKDREAQSLNNAEVFE